MLSLLEFFEEGKFKFKRNFNLKELSSIKIGPIADVFVEPENINDLVNIVAFLRKGRYRYKVVGGLTNTLFSNSRYEGVIISTSRINRVSYNKDRIYAECGVRLAALMRYAEGLGLGGYPGLCHIPGTLGGAVRGNAGAFGNEIAQIFVEGSFLDGEGEIISLTNSDLQFKYRYSRLKSEDLIMLSSSLRLLSMQREIIKEQRDEALLKRRSSQPLGERSLGSVFMRVNGVSAGYYIDMAGLKGYSVGDASVSKKHAGFIVNLGSAEPSDVISLIEDIKSEVFSRFGVSLVCEIEILG